MPPPRSTTIEVVRLVIGGLEIQLYRTADSEPTTTQPIAVAFLLHGRLRKKEDVDGFARKLVAGKEGLWVVSFDLRNHGSRMVDEKANDAWDTKDPAQHNPRHAIDMYSIQLGTARDVSFLIDFLPSYLFPNGESEICEWGVVGISLGGHSTWMALCHDPRIRIGIPIIGCPDYRALMAHRAKQEGIPLEPPHFPTSLQQVVERHDPAHKDYRSVDPQSNPFIGKQVFVLCGEEDELVPWSAGAEFVEGLEVGETGGKRVRVYSGVGHKCTDEMQEDALAFLVEKLK